jgi:predicted TIM-barrel fold metal-dependent hydrolase
VAEAWDTIDRYVVISSDAHAGADLWAYKDYLPNRWHDEFDAWALSHETDTSNPLRNFDKGIFATDTRNWDSDLRLLELDADGVAAEVLFPNTTPPFFDSNVLIMFLPKTEAEFARRWVGVQAHNRWMVDFVAEAPTRRRGLVQVFPNDVDAALAEIRWAKKAGCFGGALLAPVPPGHPVPPLFHTRYEPLWTLCEELDFPIAVHNDISPEIPMDQPASVIVGVTRGGMSWDAVVVDLVLAGVLERHPNLKIVPTEQGTRGLVLAEWLDGVIPGMKSTASNSTFRVFGDGGFDAFSLSPTEYVKRAFYFGISGPVADPSVFRMRHQIGVSHILWGNDYPHEEGTTPQSKLLLRWALEGLPEAECRQMLAGNAARLYGFDLDALIPIAKRIGPTVAEIHTPLTAEELASGGNTMTEVSAAAALTATKSGAVAELYRRPFPGGGLLQRA